LYLAGAGLSQLILNVPAAIFLAEFAQVLMPARREEGAAALLFIDLDDFKPINDRLGHAAGDAMLIELGRRMKDTLREADVPAGIGGDEFVVCCQVGGRKDLHRLVERLLSRLTPPIELDSESVTPVLSVGAAFWPEDAERLDDLMVAADQAMYQAKAESGTRVAFAQKQNQPD